MANFGHDDFMMDMVFETTRRRAQEAQHYFSSFPFPQNLLREEGVEENDVYIPGAGASPFVAATATHSSVGEAAAADKAACVPNGTLTSTNYRGVLRVLREKYGPGASPATCFSQGAHICSASRQGLTGMVKTFIEILDMPVDTREMSGRSALHVAAMHGHMDLVRYLLDKGADVGAKDIIEITPLHLGSWNNHIDIVKLLVERGADVNAVTEKMHFNGGKTPLHFAVEGRGSTDLCRFLIKKGANVNATNAGGATPLFIACTVDEIRIVAFLLEHGADPTIACIDGVTPLALASSKNSYLVMGLLMDHMKVDCDKLRDY